MAIYALSDPHLSFSTDKPMDVFGDGWKDHAKRIEEEWSAVVSPEDTVVVPGDISWAMTLEEVVPDLAFLHALPGRKIISKGNHDYWWGTVGKVEKLVAENGFDSIVFLKNNAFVTEDAVICGTRGWLLPGDSDFRQSDRVIYDRELGRLARSLEQGRALVTDDGMRLVAALHYPPMSFPFRDTEVTEILERFGVDICVYGHLHGPALRRVFEGERNGVEYHLVSADYRAFKPLQL